MLCCLFSDPVPPPASAAQVKQEAGGGISNVPLPATAIARPQASADVLQRQVRNSQQTFLIYIFRKTLSSADLALVETKLGVMHSSRPNSLPQSLSNSEAEKIMGIKLQSILIVAVFYK